MSLENTLREMMNEMKMPPYKKPLDPTVHSGPEEKPLPPGVHTGPQKPPVPSHTGSQKPKPKPSEITRKPGASKPREGMQEETLVEHYKQRLEEGLLGNIGKAVSQMDLSPGSLARATGRTASRIGNLVRGRGFKTGEDIAYERKEARAEAQRQVTPDAPKPPGRSGFVVASDKERKAERDADERRSNIRRRMLKDPRTDEISAWGGA